MSFKPYIHLERFGNTEVEGIELGKVFVFPKIDGTNASIWANPPEPNGDGALLGGSRTRQLSEDSDNAGFYRALQLNEHAIAWKGFFSAHPKLRLYGEWLVPHSFKGYREDAWRKFYVFDVYNDETEMYLSYEIYQPLLEEFGIEYIPPLATIKNASYENFLKLLSENRYLCPDGGEPGEGIIIKNYDFQNKFGRQTWAKIVRQEFKEIHSKAMGAPDINGTLMNEERIVNLTCSAALIEKTYAKIINDKRDEYLRSGQALSSPPAWSSRYIPELLNRVFYDIIREELWDSWKEIGLGTINGKTLKVLVIAKIKNTKPELFA